MTTAAEILRDLERSGIRLGLDNLRRVLDRLGTPQHAFPVVLVAGTNGKGSTSALLAEIARSAGYRVGHYTSPHLEQVEERIRIDGRAIDPAQLGALLTETLQAAELAGVEAPTYFEAMTVAALLAFAREPIDLAILEVGMGGRLDATNVCDPIVSVITSIAFDHREWLGDTLDAIAREKAGILRPIAPAILAPQLPEAEFALVDEATRRGATVVPVGRKLKRLAIRSQGLAGLELDLSTDRRGYTLRTTLAGEHQAANVATALVAAEALEDLGFTEVDEDAITNGIADCRWPGRLESVRLPGSGGVTVLLDAAHNPAGCDALARFLAQLGRPYVLLFGALADKELAQMLPPLAAGAASVVLTRPDSPRAATPDQLTPLLAPGIAHHAEAQPRRALDAALAGEPEILVVCGSIFLVGEVRTLLRERFGVPAA